MVHGCLWEALKRCWSPQPNDRPTVEAMLEHLERGSTTWQPLLPSADDGVQMDNDDESVLSELLSLCVPPFRAKPRAHL